MRNFKKPKKKVLHLTTHVGGGVGTVVLNYLKEAKSSSSYSHTVFALGYTEERSRQMIEKHRLNYKDNMHTQIEEIVVAIEQSDIVLVHWWNHPLIYDFLIRNKIPNSRIIIWSHVAGFNPPHVFTKKLLEYPDLFVFTTPISKETEEVKRLGRDRMTKTKVVVATGGIETGKKVKQKRHKGFQVGYIGTVDYAKLHPDFLHLCKEIGIPNSKFIVCGGSNEDAIRKEAMKLGLGEKITFTGVVKEIGKYLSSFDVFGYPLAPNHYGACDQTLIESMAAGVVPVVFDNRMEKSMIKNGVNGIVVKDENGYIKAVETLYKNKKLRDRLSRNAKIHAENRFSISKLVKDWENIFNKMIKERRSVHAWPTAKKNFSASDVFIESLGKYGGVFKKNIKATNLSDKKGTVATIMKLGSLPSWQSESKGTVHNYHLYFPIDKRLKMWSKLMKKAN